MIKIESWFFTYNCSNCGNTYKCDENDIKCQPYVSGGYIPGLFIECECGQKFIVDIKIPTLIEERAKNKYENQQEER